MAALVPVIGACSIRVITVCDCTSSRFRVPAEMAVAAPIILAALLLDFSLFIYWDSRRGVLRQYQLGAQVEVSKTPQLGTNQ
jgi:hypothetical protein